MIDRGCLSARNSLSGGAALAGRRDPRSLPILRTDPRRSSARMNAPRPAAVDRSTPPSACYVCSALFTFSPQRAQYWPRSARVAAARNGRGAMMPQRVARGRTAVRPYMCAERARGDDGTSCPRSPTGEGHRAPWPGGVSRPGAQPCAPTCARNGRAAMMARRVRDLQRREGHRAAGAGGTSRRAGEPRPYVGTGAGDNADGANRRALAVPTCYVR